MNAQRAFLEGILDYAGLFPPASRPLEEARGRALALLGHPQGWIVGSWVVPSSLVPALAEGPCEGLSLSVLIGRGEGDWLEGLEGEVRGVGRALEALPGVALKGWELSVPAEVSPEALARALDRLPAPVFCELLGPAPLEGRLEGLAQARERGGAVGLKLRTGGLRPEDHPSPARLAGVLEAAAGLGLPVKFTAGLHHPARTWSPAVGADQHGFLNVFVAAMLAGRPGFTGGRLREILEERSLGAFEVGEALRAFGATLAPAELRALRRERAVSFGSCSFSEPVEALRAGGWFQEPVALSVDEQEERSRA